MVCMRDKVSWVGRMSAGGSEDKSSVQSFVVEDCSTDRASHPLQLTSSKSG